VSKPACDVCNGTGVYVGLRPEALARLAAARKDPTAFTAEDLLRYEVARRNPANCLPPEPCACQKKET